jgi:hypothetical protein
MNMLHYGTYTLTLYPTFVHLHYFTRDIHFVMNQFRSVKSDNVLSRFKTVF